MISLFISFSVKSSWCKLFLHACCIISSNFSHGYWSGIQHPLLLHGGGKIYWNCSGC